MAEKKTKDEKVRRQSAFSADCRADPVLRTRIARQFAEKAARAARFRIGDYWRSDCFCEKELENLARATRRKKKIARGGNEEHSLQL